MSQDGEHPTRTRNTDIPHGMNKKDLSETEGLLASGKNAVLAETPRVAAHG
jgi:hypothetical protein